MTEKREVFVSVDIEASGPIPGEYSMLTIGACLVDDPAVTFAASLKPLSRNADRKALEVTGLSMDRLLAEGEEPEAAMKRLAAWLGAVVGLDGIPVFVGFNAAFDWSFVNYYFHRFCGSNPFGFAALDIKSLYMGATGCAWEETKSSRMREALRPLSKGDHNALHDAVYQAELFRLAIGRK
jgi:DNA polymerase III epsilon subunit-like protein